MKIQEALDNYIHELLVNQNKAITTVESYKTDLKQYLNFLLEIDVLMMEQINTNHIIDYISEITNLKKPRSVTHALSSIRGFHSYIHSVYPSIENPCIKIKMLKPQKQLPKFYKQDELEKLFNSFANDDQGIFHQAIIELLYACGLRVSELCNITLNQLSLDNEVIRVIGKGNKERIIPIAKISVNKLKDYLNVRSKWDKGRSNYLFINSRGKPITRQYVWGMLKKKSRELGINDNYSPHTIRHTFATDLLEGGADLRTVQELLGHSNISTTQIYTHVQKKKLHQMYDSFHPRGKEDEE